jgi:DNA integrity scanning protein DisA with diadenylate cyclase activity
MRGALGINVVCAHTTIDLTDAEEKNARVRASVSRLINLVRDYETEESVDDDSPNLVAEASNVGRQLFETVQRSEQNTELVNFREKRAESQQVEDKYLNVLEHAKKVAEANDVMVARLGYREVATHYGCAYKNDGYRVMEEMAERVPGVTYKESRTLCADDAMGVGGHHIEITFAHPDLAGWMRAHEANAGGNGGR